MCTVPGPAAAQAPAFTLADVVGRFGPDYRRAHRLPLHHHKVLNAVERCRTAALGGHLQACDACGHTRVRYNSCRDRHCPRCQGRARRRWVAARLADLLPVDYFHVVFTLPHQLNGLVRYNQRLLYGLLFEAASQTLLGFGRTRLGGELGVTAVLHTWGQTLVEHPHLHCLVTGGALSADGGQWRACRRGYLFPVRALAEVFRARYVAGLERAYARGALRGAGALAELASAEALGRFLRRVARRRWVVYSKRPFAGPECVVKYLGRYTLHLYPNLASW